MTTKAAETYEVKEQVPCKMCDGRFIPGGMKVPLPDGICAWCFYRHHLYRRYTALYEALQEAVRGHVDCSGKCCQIARLSYEIMNPPVSMQASEQ